MLRQVAALDELATAYFAHVVFDAHFGNNVFAQRVLEFEAFAAEVANEGPLFTVDAQMPFQVQLFDRFATHETDAARHRIAVMAQLRMRRADCILMYFAQMLLQLDAGSECTFAVLAFVAQARVQSVVVQAIFGSKLAAAQFTLEDGFGPAMALAVRQVRHFGTVSAAAQLAAEWWFVLRAQVFAVIAQLVETFGALATLVNPAGRRCLLVDGDQLFWRNR